MKFESDNILSVPLRRPVNLKVLDGKKIVTAVQYQLLINMNLTLLEYDKNTNLVTLLADDYDIKDRSIIFRIKKGIKTISGHEIKGIDAEVSLKRLILSNGSHSRLSQLLCSEDKTVECPGISSNGYELTLIAKKKSYIPFILSLLTNADNVILPLTALSSNLSNSEIITFKETTGPYFIDDTISDKNLNSFILKVNPSSFLYKKELAKEIHYTVTNYDELITNENLLKQNFNYIHNVSGLKLSQIKSLEAPDSNVDIYPTALLKNELIFTTQKGRKTFSEADLIHYSLKVRNTLLSSKEAYPNIIQEQIEYFPSGADGQLLPQQLDEIKILYSNLLNKYSPSPLKIRLGVFKIYLDKYKNALKTLNNIDVIELSGFPLDNNAENVDIFIDNIDSNFKESLDLLEYNKTFGVFNVSDDDIKKYVDSDLKDERIKILRDIHFKSLKEGRFVTIGAAPYYTILSKSWTASPPSYFVGFPAWKITKKN